MLAPYCQKPEMPLLSRPGCWNQSRWAPEQVDALGPFDRKAACRGERAGLIPESDAEAPWFIFDPYLPGNARLPDMEVVAVELWARASSICSPVARLPS